MLCVLLCVFTSYNESHWVICSWSFLPLSFTKNTHKGFLHHNSSVALPGYSIIKTKEKTIDVTEKRERRGARKLDKRTTKGTQEGGETSR